MRRRSLLAIALAAVMVLEIPGTAYAAQTGTDPSEDGVSLSAQDGEDAEESGADAKKNEEGAGKSGSDVDAKKNEEGAEKSGADGDAASSHSLEYKDNGDGTHTASCTDEDCDYSLTEEHSYTDGICVCGAEEDTDGTEDPEQEEEAGETAAHVHVFEYTDNGDGTHTVTCVAPDCPGRMDGDEYPDISEDGAYDTGAETADKDEITESLGSTEAASEIVTYPAGASWPKADGASADRIYSEFAANGSASHSKPAPASKTAAQETASDDDGEEVVSAAVTASADVTADQEAHPYTYIESHIYTDGICSLCGADEALQVLGDSAASDIVTPVIESVGAYRYMGDVFDDRFRLKLSTTGREDTSENYTIEVYGYDDEKVNLNTDDTDTSVYSLVLSVNENISTFNRDEDENSSFKPYSIPGKFDPKTGRYTTFKYYVVRLTSATDSSVHSAYSAPFSVDVSVLFSRKNLEKAGVATNCSEMNVWDEDGNEITSIKIHQGEYALIRPALYFDDGNKVAMDDNTLPADYTQTLSDNLLSYPTTWGYTWSICSYDEDTHQLVEEVTYGRDRTQKGTKVITQGSDSCVEFPLTKNYIQGLSACVQGTAVTGDSDTEKKYIKFQAMSGYSDGWGSVAMFGTHTVVVAVEVTGNSDGSTYENPAPVTVYDSSLTMKDGYQVLRDACVARENMYYGIVMKSGSTLSFDCYPEKIWDFGAERDGMKPEEGDYLHWSFGDIDSKAFPEVDEFTTNRSFQYYDGSSVNDYDMILYQQSYITTSAMENAVDEKIDSLFAEGGDLHDIWEETQAGSATREDRIKAVYDWIRSNVSGTVKGEKKNYEDARTTPLYHTAFSALFINNGYDKKQGSGTCMAFAVLFTRLTRELGVPSKVIMESDGYAHTYNLAEFDDGSWYFVDSSAGVFKKNWGEVSTGNYNQIFYEKDFVTNYLSKVKNDSETEGTGGSNALTIYLEKDDGTQEKVTDCGKFKTAVSYIDAYIDSTEADIKLDGGTVSDDTVYSFTIKVNKDFTLGFGDEFVPDKNVQVKLDLDGHKLTFPKTSKAAISKAAVNTNTKDDADFDLHFVGICGGTMEVGSNARLYLHGAGPDEDDEVVSELKDLTVKGAGRCEISELTVVDEDCSFDGIGVLDVTTGVTFNADFNGKELDVLNCRTDYHISDVNYECAVYPCNAVFNGAVKTQILRTWISNDRYDGGSSTTKLKDTDKIVFVFNDLTVTSQTQLVDCNILIRGSLSLAGRTYTCGCYGGFYDGQSCQYGSSGWDGPWHGNVSGYDQAYIYIDRGDEDDAINNRVSITGTLDVTDLDYDSSLYTDGTGSQTPLISIIPVTGVPSEDYELTQVDPSDFETGEFKLGDTIGNFASLKGKTYAAGGKSTKTVTMDTAALKGFLDIPVDTSEGGVLDLYNGTLKVAEATIFVYAVDGKNLEPVGESGGYMHWSDVTALFKTLKDANESYVIDITEDTELNSSITWPAKAASVTLKCSKETPAELRYTGDISLTTDTVFSNIKLVQQVKTKTGYVDSDVNYDDNPPAQNIKAAGHALGFDGDVWFNTPLNLVGGGKGELELDEDDRILDLTNGIDSGDELFTEEGYCTSVIAGSVSGFDGITIRGCTENADTGLRLVLMPYSVKNGKSMKSYAPTLEASTVRLLGNNVSLTAGPLTDGRNIATSKITTLTMFGGSFSTNGNLTVKDMIASRGGLPLTPCTVTAYKTFTVTGRLINKGSNNVLTTVRQTGSKADVPYLTVNGTVELGEVSGKNTVDPGTTSDRIGVKVLEALTADADGKYPETPAEAVLTVPGEGQKFTGKAQLLNAKATVAEKFVPVNTVQDSEGNTLTGYDYAEVYEGSGKYSLVKSGSGIYVSGEVSKVMLLKGTHTESEDFSNMSSYALGYYSSVAEAVKTIDGIGDSKAVYTLLLLDDYGSAEAPEKYTAPKKAGSITWISRGDGDDDYCSMYLTGSMKLLQDTYFKNVNLKPMTGKKGAYKDTDISINAAGYDLSLNNLNGTFPVKDLTGNGKNNLYVKKGTELKASGGINKFEYVDMDIDSEISTGSASKNTEVYMGSGAVWTVNAGNFTCDSMTMESSTILDASAKNNSAVTIGYMDEYDPDEDDDTDAEIKFTRTAPDKKGVSKTNLTINADSDDNRNYITLTMVLPEADDADSHVMSGTGSVQTVLSENCKFMNSATAFAASQFRMNSIVQGEDSGTILYDPAEIYDYGKPGYDEIDSAPVNVSDCIPVRASGGIYLVDTDTEDEDGTTLLDNLTVLDNDQCEQYCLDFNQAVTAINSINDAEGSYIIYVGHRYKDENGYIAFSGGIKDTNTLDKTAYSALTLPGANKAAEISVYTGDTGEDYGNADPADLIFTGGSFTMYGRVEFDKIIFKPVKNDTGTAVPMSAVMKKNTAKGITIDSNLTLDGCGISAVNEGDTAPYLKQVTGVKGLSEFKCTDSDISLDKTVFKDVTVSSGQD